MSDDRKLLELAAKAAGYVFLTNGQVCSPEAGNFDWNPLTSSADCAEMCAKLEIDWMNTQTSVICGDDSREYEEEAYLKSHDNSRLKAWMFAATMCAAKIGGYTE